MRPALVHPELSLSLSPARLRALFAKHRAPRGITAKSAPRVIARALFVGEASDALVAAFHPIARFATDDGRRAIDEAARVVAASKRPWKDDEPSADLAARLGTELARHPSTAATLERAAIRLDRLMPMRPSYDVVASSPRQRVANHAKRIAPALRRALGDAFEDAWDVVDDQGRVHIAVLYRAVASVTIDGATLRRDVRRVLRADTLRVDADGARLFVTTATPEHLFPYAAAIGDALFDDASHFTPRPAFTFKRVQALGASGFAQQARPRGVRAWSVIGVQWDSGVDARFEVRGVDALTSLDSLVTVSGGHFRKLTVRLVLDDAPNVVDVVMQLPNRIDFSDMRHESSARAALGSLGVFSPGALPDDARTLAPYVHPEWRWREVVGDAAFKRLCASNLLERVAARPIAAGANGAVGGSLSTHDLPSRDDVKYALAEDRSIAARDVQASELRAWKLDEAKLVAKLRAELGVVAPAKNERVAVAGLVDVGVMRLRDGRVHFVYPMARHAKGMIDAVRAVCGLGVTPVFLVPKGRSLGVEGVVEVELGIEEQFGAANAGRVVGRAAEILGFTDEVEPWRLAADGEELVLDRATKRAWLRGVYLTKIGDVAYRIFECLVDNTGRIVPTGELGVYASPKSGYPDVMVRKTRAEIPAQVRASFVSAGVEIEDGLAERIVLLEGRNGYRLGVGARIIG